VYYGVFSCTPNGGRQFLSNRRSNPISYHCVGNLTVYLLENSNLSCVDRHLGYMKKLRSKPLPLVVVQVVAVGLVVEGHDGRPAGS
jgi:hypothetical protein